MDTSCAPQGPKLLGPSNSGRPKMPSFLRVPGAARVKNKRPSAVQITAEQILLEARDQRGTELRPPKRKIVDSEELAERRVRKRKEFEDMVRRAASPSVWLKYARWEESQRDMARSRSVFERALDTFAHRDHTLWLNYAEFEMRNRSVKHARNVWDRAVAVLPLVDQLWYKYIHMEELLGAVTNARQVFERWTRWARGPARRAGAAAWKSFVKFELRYGEVGRARDIYERLVREQPRPGAFVQYAKFEMKHGEVSRARRVYEQAMDVLDPEDEDAELLLLSFANFVETHKEVDRARAIYRFGLDRLPMAKTKELYSNYLAFEKMFGDQKRIEDTLMMKKRLLYEDEVTSNPLNYDGWFDYLRLEESLGNKDRIKEVYKRAVSNVPPAEEKRYWKRYIYIWIMRALFEEIDAQDVEQARAVYRDCLKQIPHRKFTFAKVWLMAAQFEIRQKNLKSARQILGNAIGMAPKGKIFKKYIEFEMQLGNIDRCRILYEKFIEWDPSNCYAWLKYAEMEKNLRETDRARTIFELAIAQPALDTPELLWKEYLNFEKDENELGRTRELYERLLDKTKHLKVWISYADFEASAGLRNEDTGCEKSKNAIKNQDSLMERVQRSRAVFERAFDYFSNSAPELQEEMSILLKEWLGKEISFGGIGDVSLVQSKTLRKVMRKRPIPTEEHCSRRFDELADGMVADEVGMTPKIMKAAYEWKKRKSGGFDTSQSLTDIPKWHDTAGVF
ncbi:hypothetical protein E2562_023192 [Oryza meyeriana var. granulata]|uniref:Pre-mRNA-splicing factor Syf1-like N-terminal HAT-repeats domain-containing protein n=1 Tax=Oryza meyeriana var. granulata TaxID=110450 RepID=A0A6G1BXW5_9ORYZ|nr:hypothetical protein E2562_023192 [Oryza meyeriana var. granulata]